MTDTLRQRLDLACSALLSLSTLVMVMAESPIRMAAIGTGILAVAIMVGVNLDRARRAISLRPTVGIGAATLAVLVTASLLRYPQEQVIAHTLVASAASFIAVLIARPGESA
jgi:hypothetical protein